MTNYLEKYPQLKELYTEIPFRYSGTIVSNFGESKTD